VNTRPGATPARTQSRPAHLPLQGVRVLAVEQFGSGPYGTMFLAQLGAEVLKIENPASRGDPARQTGPYMLGADDSQYFQGWNLNKRSVLLDIKSAQGRAAFERLVPGADVVLNNLRGDQPAKLGLDHASLKRLNPALVCVHISAYGRDNSRAAWPGYDYLMQAETGLMQLTGEPGTPPTRVGAPSIVDHTTGLTSIIGLLAALLRARETGVGCDVDTSLFDVTLHQLGYTAIWYLNEGHAPQRQPRSGHYSLAPVQTFPTADGWIFVMCMTPKFWEALLHALGRQELRDRAEFKTAPLRHRNQAQLTEILDREFRAHPTSHWLARLQGVLPVAPIRGLAETLDSAFVRECGMLSAVEHPARGELKLLASPLRFDGRRPPLRACAPLGHDTQAVLQSITPQREAP